MSARRIAPARALPLAALAFVIAACASPEERVAEHVAKARALMASEDFDKAKLEAKSAVQIQPKNAEARYILAQLAWRDGDFGKAFPELQMAVESDPTLLDARIRLGDLYVAARDVPAAEAQAEAAAKLAPDRADVRLLQAKVLFIKGDPDGAVAAIDAALAADPAYVPALINKASLMSGRGDTAGALAVLDAGLEKAKGADADSLREFRLQLLRQTGQDAAYEAGLKALIAEFPDRKAYRYQLLGFYADAKRRDDEEAVLRELLTVDPEDQQVKLRLAARLVQQRDVPAAEALLRDNIARYPDSADLLLGLGDLYRSTGRPAEAMAVYRKAAEKWADTTAEGQRARNRVVAQHAVDGDIPAAKAEVEAILKAAPDNPDALLTRATFAFVERRYDPAIADLRAVLRRRESPEAVLLLARAYVGAGDLVTAKDTYRQLLAIDPQNAEANTELAALLTREGDPEAGAELLRGLLARKPDDPKASLALVDSLLAKRDLAAAEAEAKRLVERGVGGVEVEERFGQVLQAKGSTAEALARYRSILERDPKQVAALEGLVTILLDGGRAAEAIDFLEQYPPDNLDASLLRGRAYARQGDVVAAREEHERAIRAVPGDTRAYVALAALAPADSPEQQAALERAFRAVPGEPGVALLLGSLHERAGRTAEAITVYEAAARKEPGNVVMANNLAALLLDRPDDPGAHARALDLAKPFAKANDPILLDTLGWAYFRTSDVASAVRTLERAVALDGGNAVLQYHLGKAYAAAGNAAGARQHLKLAVEKGGDQAFAADARSSLAKLGG